MKIKVLFLLFSMILFFACRSDESKGQRIQKGTFRATITETGELLALNSKVVTMPTIGYEYGRGKLVAMEKEGTFVKKGDVVALIDTSGVVRYLIQKQSELAIAEADLQQMTVRHESALKNMEADLKSEQASLQQAIIDTQRTSFESESNKEIARLKYKSAQISYEKAIKNIEHTKTIQKEEKLIQLYKNRQIQSDIDKTLLTLEMCKLRAPADGMIEYKMRNWRTREKYKVGDEPYRGEPIIGLPDMSKMKAATVINETDIDKVFKNQNVLVRLDAFPKEVFEGNITYIGKICREKDRDSKVKVFDVEILLNESKSICRPGMTVSCEIVVAQLDDVLFVDNKYVIDEKDNYYLIIQKGARTNKIPITLGPRNNEAVVVYGELREGEKLVLPQQEENT